MPEGYDHLKLKKRAQDLLRQRGFSESEIKTEYKLRVFNKLQKKDVIYRVDVYGERYEKGTKLRIAIECGNTSKNKVAALREAGLEVIHLPYSINPPFTVSPKTSETLQERKKILIKKYQDDVYPAFKDRDELDFIPYDTSFFRLEDRKGAWMNFSISDPEVYNESQQKSKITWGMSYEGANKFAIFIGCYNRSAIKKFLEISEDTKKKLLDEFSKLADCYFTQVGHAYPQTGAPSVMPGSPENWTDTAPYQSNKMNEETLEEIETELAYYFENSDKTRSPRLNIVKYSGIESGDVIDAINDLIPIFLLLVKAESKDAPDIRKLLGIPDLFDFKGDRVEYVRDQLGWEEADFSDEKIRKLIRAAKHVWKQNRNVLAEE